MISTVLKYIGVGLLLGSISQAVIAAELADNVQLHYELINSIVAGDDNAITLTVYTDGLVKVHYPAFRTRAGDYEAMLSQAELNDLLNEMQALGVVDTDERQMQAAVANQRRQADNASNDSGIVTIRQVRTDAELTRITMRKSDGSMHQTQFRGVEFIAQQHAGIQSLKGFSTAASRLKAMAKTVSLTSVER